MGDHEIATPIFTPTPPENFRDAKGKEDYAVLGVAIF